MVNKNLDMIISYYCILCVRLSGMS